MSFYEIIILIINVSVAVLFVASLRYLIAFMVGVHAKDELDKKDNVAFGVVAAGAILGMMLMLTGVMSGEGLSTIFHEFGSLFLYGIVGTVLLVLGVLIQDLLVMRDISLSKNIKSENIAAGIVVAANMIAIGWLAKKTITWLDTEGLDGVVPLIVVFILSQVVLAGVAFFRMKVYSNRHQNSTNEDIPKTWQAAIVNGNIALAIRYAGQIIATAIAIAGTTFLILDDGQSLMTIIPMWLFTSVVLAITVWLFYKLIIFIVLKNVNLVEEVDNQNNIGVAAIEAAIFIGISVVMLGYII
jgi:uncharacterized membrane protein YjfL (UPF0719 family)